MDAFEEIKKIIVKELSVDKEEITLDAHLQDDLGADSYALMTIAEAIGTKFGIKLELDDLVDIECAEDLVKVVESRG
jgi:acyl carrier protein